MLALYITAGLLLFLVILLLIPVETKIFIDTSSGEKYKLRVSWLFGLIKKDVRKREKRKPEKQPVEEKEKKIYRFFGSEIMSGAADIARIAGRFKNLGIDVYHRLKFGDITGDFVIGLEDPALTGMLFAVVGPVNAILNLHPRYHVNIRPYFEDEDIIEGSLSGSMAVRPIRLIVPSVRFILSRDVFRMGKSYLKKRRKRRK